MNVEDQLASAYRPKLLKEEAQVAPAGEKQRLYDPASGQIWELNATQAQVWDHSDGHRTVAELAGSLRDAGHTNATEKTVWQALGAFHKAKLLAKMPDAATISAAVGRRSALKRLGAGLGAAAALGILGFDRRAAATQHKVLICHQVPIGNRQITLSVAQSAVPAHLDHGDFAGDCSTPA
jgi:hypothetical protein